MTQGISVKSASNALGRKGSLPLWEGAAALCLFVSLWGCLLSMARPELPLPAALHLLPGGALCLLGRRWRGRKALLVPVLAAVALLVFRDGWKYLLNCLFAASEARQSYTYVKFPVGRAGGALAAALLPLGLLSGAALGRWRRGTAVTLLVALWGLSAWLGVSPGPAWTAALLLSSVLSLWDGAEGGPTLPDLLSVLALLLALGAVVALLFPGESAPLSSWEETARDRLSTQAVAYVEEPQPSIPPTPVPEETAPPPLYDTEDASAALGGSALAWAAPPAAFWVILLFALLLFVPALLSDALRRRREKNRAGMDSEDIPHAVCACFLYALEWMKLGGLAPENCPFAAYSPQVEALFSPALRQRYEALLPLWQEAAYSCHPLPPERRVEMAAFAGEVRQAVWGRLGPRRRFWVKYIRAL